MSGSTSSDVSLPPVETPPDPTASLAEDMLARAVEVKAPGRAAPTAPPAAGSRRWLMHRVLVLADVVALMCAFGAAEVLTGGRERIDHVGIGSETVLFVLTLPAWVVVAKLQGLYDNDEERTDHTTVDDLVGVLYLVTLGTWFSVVIGWMTGWAEPSVPKLLCFWALAIALVTFARVVARAVARRSRLYMQNALIVGAGTVGQLVARKLQSHREYGIRVVGYVDSEPPDDLDSGVPVVGDVDELSELIEALEVQRVIVAFSRHSHDALLRILRVLRNSPVLLDIVPRLFEIIGPKADLHTVEGLPLVGSTPVHLSRSSRLAKRTMDLFVSAATLLVLSLPIAVIALLIKLDSQGSAFFRQVRCGSGDRTFRIFKFRTMRTDAEDLKGELRHLNMHVSGDPRMFKVSNDPRVTRVGRFLRRFSLDELPQLINVLAGDMSLVGPRPLIPEEDDHVREWARTRLDLKPGMTGLWQVLGASDIPFEEMTRLDYIYVTNWSLWGDVRLILRTLPALLQPRRAY